MRDYNTVLFKVQRRIHRASAADSRARAAEKLGLFRPTAEEEYREANGQISAAIRILEKLQTELWNMGAEMGFKYYAAKRKAGFEDRSDADYAASKR